MKNFRYILTTISLAVVLALAAQDTLPLAGVGTISCFDIDVKGNIWVADDSYTLYKYSPSGKQITNVNIKSYGKITSIDCSNPFEIYVFCKDVGIIVFYDNMLNLKGEVRLGNHYLSNTICITRSYDNHIWLLDMSEYKLLKINKKGEIMAESFSLNNMLGEALHPYKIWEENNNVYIADSLVGIHQFDIYATYTSTHHFKNNSAVAMGESNLFFNQNKKLVRYHMMMRMPLETSLVLPANTSFVVVQNKLYFSDDNKIISYPTE